MKDRIARILRGWNGEDAGTRRPVGEVAMEIAALMRERDCPMPDDCPRVLQLKDAVAAMDEMNRVRGDGNRA